MIKSNKCPECGKILDESALDNDTLKSIQKQVRENNPCSDSRVIQHKLTTCNSIQGFKVIRNIGLVSGETVLGTGIYQMFLLLLLMPLDPKIDYV